MKVGERIGVYPMGRQSGYRHVTPSGQRRCQARSYPNSIFRSIEGGERADESHTTNHPAHDNSLS